MKNNEIFNKLCDFIVKEYWGSKEKMTLETKLEKNLGITGDEGIEFLEKFLTHFNIEHDKNREWQLHFGAEGFGLINFVGIYKWLIGKKDNQKQYDLKLGHLVKVIELGYWIDMKEQ